MTTAAIPVDELVPPPEQLLTILFVIYVYFCKNVLLNRVQGNTPLPLIHTYIIRDVGDREKIEGGP